MTVSNFIGWDIGGAHLKVASVGPSGCVDYVEQFATPLWQGLEQLERALPKTLQRLPEGKHAHALTMTAELVDIFQDRQQGMTHLIQLCESHLGDSLNFYAIEDGLLTIDTAKTRLNKIASANWHASVLFAAARQSSGLFIDVGSTTTDIIPFHDNAVLSRGVDDQTRLRFDELVYTGVIRTPLMAITNKVPFNGEWQTIAAEHFATMADVYRILNKLQDDDDLMETVDGQPKDIESSRGRLARMVGCDASDYEPETWFKLANYFFEMQLQQISAAVLRVMSNNKFQEQTIVGAGTGRFLIEEVAERLGLQYIEFSTLFDVGQSLKHKSNVCAPAVALAQLNRSVAIA